MILLLSKEAVLKKKIFLDEHGYAQYEQTIAEAKRKLTEIQREKSEAAGISHDWHDNAGFEFAKVEETKTMGEIQQLLGLRDSIEMIKRGDDRTVVDIGDTINADSTMFHLRHSCLKICQQTGLFSRMTFTRISQTKCKVLLS